MNNWETLKMNKRQQVYTIVKKLGDGFRKVSTDLANYDVTCQIG